MIVRLKLTLTMMTALAPDRGQIEDGGEALASLREASARWASRERARPRCPSGVSRLDEALGGGWPQGRVCELVGPRSCGRTGVAIATLAAATARGEVAAWIDGADALDPASAAAAGVCLDRVLWVRPRALGETVRAAEMVLEAGGFTALVLDLGAGRAPAHDSAGGATAATGGERRDPLRLRLARAAERAGAVALVLAERPWAGASAAVTVLLDAACPVWARGAAADERRGQGSVVSGQCPPDSAGSGCGSRVWLAGLELSFHLQRGSARTFSPSERAEGF
jgi:hypothetical protein